MLVAEPSAATVGGTSRSRAVLRMALRVAVSGLLLSILIPHLPDADEIFPKESHASTFALLGAAFLATLGGVLLSARRWQTVLKAFDAHVPLPTLVSHLLAGMFVGNALPGTIGGDVLRVSRSAKSTGSSTTAFAAVVIERLTGFVALPFLTLVAFAVNPSLLDHKRAWLALLIACVTLLTLAVILIVAGHPRLAGRFALHENSMRFVGAVHVGIDDLRRRPHATRRIFAAAVTYQASVVLSVLLIIRALELPLPTAAVVAFIPAVAIAQVLPISISGLGVREGLLSGFLTGFGIQTGQAVAVGLLWYGMTLLVSLLGAPSFATGHRKSHQHSKDPAS